MIHIPKSARIASARNITRSAVAHQHGLSYIKQPRTVSVLGAPMSLGQPKPGVDLGPTVLRKANLKNYILEENWHVKDCGDCSIPSIPEGWVPHPKAHNSFQVGGMNQELCRMAEQEASSGNFVLTLGGDHSLAIGSVAGILNARPNTGIIWVDAHADINTPTESGSGNIHGMAVAFLMGLDRTHEIPGFEWMQKCNTLKPEQIVYIALRDVDQPERRLLRDLRIRAYTMHEIDRWGIGHCMSQALDYLSRYDNFHISYDIDAVDPEVAPSTGTTVRGGLNYREAHFICEEMASTGMLGSFDMAEVNPALSDIGAVGEKTLAKHGLALHPGHNLLHGDVDSEKEEQLVKEATIDMSIGLIRSALGDSILDFHMNKN